MKDASVNPSKKNSISFETVRNAEIGYIAFDASLLIADSIAASLATKKLALPSSKRAWDGTL